MMVGKKKNQVTALVEALSERDSSTTAPGIEGQKPGISYEIFNSPGHKYLHASNDCLKAAVLWVN